MNDGSFMIDNLIYKQIVQGYMTQKFNLSELVLYDSKYLAKYEKYNKVKDECLNFKRVKTLFEVIPPSNVKKVFDIGYGNGTFLKSFRAVDESVELYGYDIVKGKLPSFAKEVIIDYDHYICPSDETREFDVTCFFDSLEHIPVIDIRTYLKNIKTKYLFISVPWYHTYAGLKWFKGWNHRRPNEHLHHFDAHGLIYILRDLGYNILHVSNFEDNIRKSETGFPNILSVIAQKNKELE